MSGSFAPDQSQSVAIEVDPDVRQIVIAGAGAGKTQVVAALASRLMHDEGLDPFTELLVVSFSRAAVYAAVDRLRAQSEDRPIPSPRTLDSFATGILIDCGIDPAGQSFDTRIVNARKALERQDWTRVEELQHVIIDEVQDVVGVRADFVLTLLRSIDRSCGFTLLGDPAQSIYDFQLGTSSTTTSADLLDAARDLGLDHEVVLTGQYRANGRKVLAAMNLRDDALDPARAARTMQDFEEDLPRDRSLSTFAGVVPQMPGRTVFLTGTNGEALVVADALADAGLPTALRRSAADRTIDARLAIALADNATPNVAPEEFSAMPEFGSRTKTVWRALRRASSTYGTKVDLRMLTRTLATRSRIPEELLVEDRERFVVSTIHRAKGLEFDNVVLMTDKPALDEDPAAWARTRYVALTRARRFIAAADHVNTWNLRKDSRKDRWYKSAKGSRWPLALEIQGDDIDREAPCNGRPTQDWLTGSVQPGDPVALRLDPYRSTVDSPVYDVLHGDVAIGRTSGSFGSMLSAWVGPARERDRQYLPWPNLEGARVECVETVCGAAPSAGDVGRWGMWLGVRLVGLVRLQWKADR